MQTYSGFCLTFITPYIVSFDDFPYFIDERSKSLLKECASSHLKQQKALRKYGARLKSSNHKILIRSIPGTELCRERVVSALARELQVPLLKLDDEHGCDKERGGRVDVDENRVSALKKGDRVQYVGRKYISFKEVYNRFFVGTPNVNTRSKLLQVLLNEEKLESGFSFDRLAEVTEGYSESDLKNLSVAAARRPFEEFLEQESTYEALGRVSALRAIKLNDFIHSKTKVGQTLQSIIMKLREWNEKYGAGECQW